LQTLSKEVSAIKRLEQQWSTLLIAERQVEQNTLDAAILTHALLLSVLADTQQKGFFGRSLRKLESLLDKGSNSPLALDPDLASRLNSEQIQLLHLNRALLYYLSGLYCIKAG
jgi:hypothetical protein